MNKELLNQLSLDEQQVAVQINSAAEAMKLSPSFQWELETRLMAVANKNIKSNQRWRKLMPSLVWIVLAGCAVLLVNWTVRSLVLNPSHESPGIATPKAPFLSEVHQGTMCVGRLAVEHGFNLFLTNSEKTQLVAVDAGQNIDEVHSFVWSADGKQLGIIGNTTGTGAVYIANPDGGQNEYLLSGSGLPYVMNGTWSRDGKQFVLWSAQDNTVLYLMSADGAGLVQKPLEVQILGTPQFAPDGQSVFFYGADTASAGLFEVTLSTSETTLINPFVEDESSFAFSPDGSQLAYMEYHHDLGEAQLWSENLRSHETTLLGKFEVPKGSGSSVPSTANLSWAADGESLVFDVGRGANDRVIYFAHTDGTGLVKIIDAGYAAAISSDGKCLAYMNDKQLFLLDLTATSTSTPLTPVWLADIPAAGGNPNYQLNKLQWQP